MNAVGIDVSKGKSTVTIRRPGMWSLCHPAISHTPSPLSTLLLSRSKILTAKPKPAWSISEDTMNRLPTGSLTPASLSSPKSLPDQGFRR